MDIRLYKIMETSYGDYTYWLEYKINGCFGYIITDDPNKYTTEKLNSMIYELFIDKKHINVCSKYLAAIIEECRQSDNDMYFVEYGELEEDHPNVNEFLEELQKEIHLLGISPYVKLNEDGCYITVYGGVITKFLF